MHGIILQLGFFGVVHLACLLGDWLRRNERLGRQVHLLGFLLTGLTVHHLHHLAVIIKHDGSFLLHLLLGKHVLLEGDKLCLLLLLESLLRLELLPGQLVIIADCIRRAERLLVILAKLLE